MSGLNSGDNLFDKIGKKTSTEEASTDASSQSAGSAGNSDVGKAKSGDKDAAVNSQTGAGVDSAESKSASGKEEPSGSNVKDPESWDTESAFKEIKKLREENKAYRLKYSEKLEQLKADSDSTLEAERAKLAELEAAKKELDRLKAQEEDKKRSQEEKIINRETRIAELESQTEALKSEAQKQLDDARLKIQALEADREAEQEIYKSRLNEEVAKIPEKFKDHAALIIKGAGDPRDALVALHEAKLSGMFEEKKVVVNHSVPGAQDGARASKDQLDNAAREQRSGMNSSQKIKAALQDIRGGNKNSAFKSR